MNLGTLGIIAGAAVIAGAVILSELIVVPETRTDGRIVVTYWEKWSDFEFDAMRKVVDEFNNSQDKIFVEVLSVPNIAQKTMLATSGGIPPDIAGLFGGNVAQYAYNNAVIPLDELAAEAGIKESDYLPAFYNFCTYRGKLWALPSTPASTALHYNVEMIRAAGFSGPPKTIEELTALDDKVVRRENGDLKKMGFLPTEPGWWPFAWGTFFGGELWDGESKITMTTPEMIRAYEWMGSFAKKYGSGTVTSFKEGFGTFKSADNSFMAGKVASQLQGVWMHNFITTFNPDLNYSVAPFPHPADRPDLAGATMLDLDILVIPRGAKHPKEAFEFIKFVQSQKGMEMLCLGQKKNSPLAKTSAGFLENHPNPHIKLFQELGNSKNAFAPPKTPIWAQWSAEISTATQSINSGSKTAEQALRDVQEKMQPLLDAVIRREKAMGLYKSEGGKN
jgi:ABC-type glycerol-3-phosphate transport system substrate-binding protein